MMSDSCGDVNVRLAYQDLWNKESDMEAGGSSKTSICEISGNYKVTIFKVLAYIASKADESW
jgi:hypothetical protein